MTEFVAGGRRRIDRVLAPGYLDGIAALDLDEVRVRRAEADQEEVDLSYARRLLQGRIDILKAEKQRRDGGGALLPPLGTRGDAAIVEALKRILGDERRTDHGLGRHMTSSPSRVGEHRREAEAAVADVGGSDLNSMDDVQLNAAIVNLSGIEARVSRSRRSVQQVVDALTVEVARRYNLDNLDPASMADTL
jgi:hypothetical protein